MCQGRCARRPRGLKGRVPAPSAVGATHTSGPSTARLCDLLTVIQEPDPMPTTYEIHPSIGMARVGTSARTFVGPEPDGNAPDSYRDNAGNLLRQAARFRVFQCDRDASGKLTEAAEVTASVQ